MKKPGFTKIHPFFLPVLLAVLPLGGCKMGAMGLPGLPGTANVRLLETEGEDFSALLAQEYRNLAVFEEDFMNDPEAAAHYAAKAIAAAKKTPVLPDNPLEIAVPPPQKPELLRGYDMVMDALARLDSEDNAALLALAQTRYDCWLERAAEKGDEAEQSICRDMMTRALGLLSIPQGRGLRYEIRFTGNETVLDDESMAIIEKAAGAWEDHPFWEVTLTGHAAAKGNRAQNRRLSLRRALAVRNYLAQQGIDPDKISIIAYTDSREDANPGISRQVDIRFEPVYVMKEGPLYESLEEMD